MQNIAFMGFGEAGQTFAKGLRGAAMLQAYDIKLDHPNLRAHMQAQILASGAKPVAALSDLATAGAVFCLVTADQALAAATAAAPYLAKGTIWLDGNSAAPSTKRAADALITAAGAIYMDMAIMAPVQSHKTPILLSGPQAAQAHALLGNLGMNSAIAGPQVGDASSIKMLRSVIIKGIEALTAEAFLAARRAGVERAVIASLQASDSVIDWQTRPAYNLERMLVHGARRSAEMHEVARCLEDLGLPSRMTLAAAAWQQNMASLGIAAGPDDLAARADTVLQAMA